MKKIITYALCAVCAVVLLNCSPTNTRNYIVINKTDSHIGVMVDYYSIVAVVDPSRSFEHYEKASEHRPGVSDYKLSNLDDTTSIIILSQQIIMIREKMLTSKIDTILYNAYSCYGRYTYQWVVTDELLSIMTHDETLLAEFPDFYKK